MPHDVVIVGGGHNGLTAAAYLARAGRLRAAPRARRPRRRRGRLGAGLRGRRRPALALLVPREPAPAAHHRRPRARHPARASPLLVVHARPGGPRSRAAHRPRGGRRGIRRRLRARRRRRRRRRLGRVLRRDRAARRSGSSRRSPSRCPRAPRRASSWATTAPGTDFVERPLGSVIDERFTSDLVRGVVATDGLIGTFTDLDDPALDAQPLLPLPRDRRRHRRLGRARSAAWARSAASSPVPLARRAPSS